MRLTGQERTGQSKRHKVVIFRLFGEKPSRTKICSAGNVADMITCAKFQDEIFRGYNFTRDRISYFPLDFCIGLTTLTGYVCYDLRYNF